MEAERDRHPSPSSASIVVEIRSACGERLGLGRIRCGNGNAARKPSSSYGVRSATRRVPVASTTPQGAGSTPWMARPVSASRLTAALERAQVDAVAERLVVPLAQPVRPRVQQRHAHRAPGAGVGLGPSRWASSSSPSWRSEWQIIPASGAKPPRAGRLERDHR